MTEADIQHDSFSNWLIGIGIGEQTVPNGTIHKGIFDNGQLIGVGKITLIDDFTIKDHFTNGILDEVGTFTVVDGVEHGVMLEGGKFRNF